MSSVWNTFVETPQIITVEQPPFPPESTLHTGIFRTRLSVGTTPAISTPQVLYIQCRTAHSDESGILRVWIYQGSTLIETYDITLNNTFTLNGHTIINYAAITDWSDIEVAVQGISDPGYDLSPQVSWIEMDIPSS